MQPLHFRQGAGSSGGAASLPDVRRQVVRADDVPRRQDEQPLDGVAEFPDVPRPGIIRQGLEGFRREVSVNDLCRREGIKPSAYYAWTKEFMEAGKERLARDAARDATRLEVETTKRENAELKHLVAELSLEVYRLKKTAVPLFQGEGGAT